MRLREKFKVAEIIEQDSSELSSLKWSNWLKSRTHILKEFTVPFHARLILYLHDLNISHFYVAACVIDIEVS